MHYSTRYILLFAAAVCGICAVVVAGAAVLLEERQLANVTLDRQAKVLTLAGLVEEGASLTSESAAQLFDESIQSQVIDLKTGSVREEIDAATFDQRKAARDVDTSFEAPDNPAKVRRLPNNALVYRVVPDGKLRSIIVPISGQGLWSTLYGYLALNPDGTTIEGITFYEHKETPGLGGEIDNPRWKALWPGRKAFDDKWKPVIAVKKGTAGPPEEDPYQVDGLSGATITSRGVGFLVRFWLGDDGFGPYLEGLRTGGSS
jgi:Na+-transporting NADH:ubiquinone oxidoreductase subunit C